MACPRSWYCQPAFGYVLQADSGVGSYAYSPQRQICAYCIKKSVQLSSEDYLKIARMTHNTFLYTLPIKSSLQYVGKEKVVYSVPVLHPDTVKQVIALINMAEREQRDCVFNATQYSERRQKQL